MNKECNALLQNIFDGGSVPVSNTVESQQLMGELMDRGLVEIARPSGQSPDGHPPSPEYQLTSKGKDIAEFLRGK
jgi:DNA-binding HxlR family transcriptional regulator